MVPMVLPSLIPPEIEPMTHFDKAYMQRYFFYKTQNHRMSIDAGMINRRR